MTHVIPIGQLGDAADLPEGLCNSIATELARFRDIRVFRTGGSDAAQFVLDGTVQCLGSRLRVTVRLLEQQTGQQIWAERYDHSTEDLFTTQDQLAARVATTVAARLTMLVHERAQHRAPHDLRAFECFVEGNRHVDRLDSPVAQEQARSWFEQALQIEPTFARAHTGLAFVSAMRSFLTDIGKPAAENLDIALCHAETALDLDPTDPRVHYTLAYVCLLRREFERSERHFLPAVELNPNDPTILIMWGYAQACVGHAEAGLRTLESALRYMLSPPYWYFTYRARVLVLATDFKLKTRQPLPTAAAVIVRRQTATQRAQQQRGLPMAPAACRCPPTSRTIPSPPCRRPARRAVRTMASVNLGAAERGSFIYKRSAHRSERTRNHFRNLVKSFRNNSAT